MQSLKKILLVTTIFLGSLSYHAIYAESEISSLEKHLHQLKIEEKEAEQLHHLFQIYWDWHMLDNPEEASFWGSPGKHNSWSDLSEEAFIKRQAFMSLCLDTLHLIELSKLNEDDKISYQILKRILEEGIANIQFGKHYLAFNQMDGIHLHIPLIMGLMPHQTIEDYEDIFSRLRLIPKLFEQTISLLEKGKSLRMTPPQVALLKVPDQLLNQIVDNPIDSSLLKAFHSFPSSIDASTQSYLLDEAQYIYQNIVKPAFIQFHTYLTEKYIPHCRQTTALADLPNGNALYSHLVQSFTTTTLTPQDIHNIGLKEVERIHQDMLAIIRSTPFKGSFEEFLHFLKTDPQFFYSKREELLEGYRTLTNHIQSHLPLLFNQLPSLPFQVVPVPTYSEESQIAAYYCPGSIAYNRPGYFFINTSYPEQRPKWEMEPLALHEAVPGHHMQISLAQELIGIPEFRKNANFTAYIEGWGLYAESLGAEMGLYRDSYSVFGKLSYEMLRAIRLVVDTGMHAMGWSREQAILYFKQYVGMSDHEITTEIDRYLVIPGQALAYKIGELKIQDMRRLAAQQLDEKFDIRSFHHIWLKHGTLPLDIAEQQVHKWLQDF